MAMRARRTVDRRLYLFVCVHCGYSNNADINAAINIKNRFLDSLEAGSEKGQDMPRWPRGNSNQTKSLSS
ncbi:MAG: transposase [Candidatus Anaerobiospirillum pullicola]|uniref:Transposase n=1 Tax=Candidatus Anaerobiospirillum pullicola TaxID=2838451 RepID=A0A948THM9_9GAMM|nr:transposase [Candidatus Anaerobiospirillum pullicola]